MNQSAVECIARFALACFLDRELYQIYPSRLKNTKDLQNLKALEQGSIIDIIVKMIYCVQAYYLVVQL